MKQAAKLPASLQEKKSHHSSRHEGSAQGHRYPEWPGQVDLPQEKERSQCHKPHVRQTKAGFLNEHPAGRAGSRVTRREQRGSRDLPAQRRSRRQVINGITRHAQLEKMRPGHRPVGAAQATSPSHGVNHLRHSFRQNEREHSPTEPVQLPPKSPDTESPAKIAEKSNPQEQ